jgi:hypothetical protein
MLASKKQQPPTLLGTREDVALRYWQRYCSDGSG